MSRHGPAHRAESSNHKTAEEVRKELELTGTNAKHDLEPEKLAAREKSQRHAESLTSSIENSVDANRAVEMQEILTVDVHQEIATPSSSLSSFVGPEPGGGSDKVALDLDADQKKLTDLNESEHKKKPSKEARNLHVQYVMGITGVVTLLFSAGSFVYLAVKDNANGRNDLSDPEIRRLANAWKDKPDVDFWDEMANYFEKNPQIPMVEEANVLKVIQPLCRETGWVWASKEEFNRAVSEFSSDIQSGNTAPAYREVTVRTYYSIDAPNTPALLPRRIACDVLNLAIARYLRQQQ